MRIWHLLFVCVLFLAGQSSADEQMTGPITGFASLVGMKGIIVTPVNRTETALLIDAGSINTDGYTGLVINIAGQIEASVSRPGILGAVLIPDLAPYDYAFKTLGMLPATMEVTVPLQTGQNFFMANQIKFDIGFPRYRVLFYNTSDATARLSFFAYRTKD